MKEWPQPSGSAAGSIPPATSSPVCRKRDNRAWRRSCARPSPHRIRGKRTRWSEDQKREIVTEPIAVGDVTSVGTLGIV